MNQFKDVFLGVEQRDYMRATTCQKCVRAGGKHNDLENVGFTNRHHTFFEMLGNFSFGDYFKKDAIAFAWELVTSPQWFGIPKDKLYVTIFKGEEGIARDAEAYDEWVNQGVEKSRIHELGIAENFWAMGDTGPCGPCSEIHYDMGPDASDQGHADCQFPCDCGRYVEIWNFVFMQFNRDAIGTLNPLPKPSVDTGLGPERMAAVVQGKISNFDTDLFQPLIEEAARLANVDRNRGEIQPSLRIIADHSRGATFLISDGVVPSNDGRGYVLRKIIRRALRHARMLNAPTPFLSVMSAAVRAEMADAYPELEEHAARISSILDEEERRFVRKIGIGLSHLSELLRPFDLVPKHAEPITDLKKHVEPINLIDRQLFKGFVLPGADAFRLFDTYGLPRDFIEDTARDAGVQVDWAGYNRAMEARVSHRASWKGVHKEAASPVYSKLAEISKTEPDFYFGTETRDCRIEAIVTKDGLVNELPAGAEGEVVLDRTTIYAESGGQVGRYGLVPSTIARPSSLRKFAARITRYRGWSHIVWLPRKL